MAKSRQSKRDLNQRKCIFSKKFSTWLDMVYGSGSIESDGKGEDRDGYLHYWWEDLYAQSIEALKKRRSIPKFIFNGKPLPI
jgi:hypothetical protein